MLLLSKWRAVSLLTSSLFWTRIIIANLCSHTAPNADTKKLCNITYFHDLSRLEARCEYSQAYGFYSPQGMFKVRSASTVGLTKPEHENFDIHWDPGLSKNKFKTDFFQTTETQCHGTLGARWVIGFSPGGYKSK